MKPLSESLRDLAARVKQLDESAAAVQERNRAALQKRREKLDAAIDREVLAVVRAELSRGEADQLAVRS